MLPLATNHAPAARRIPDLLRKARKEVLKVSQNYDVGEIRAKNLAFGPHAKAKYVARPDAKQASMQAEALYQIRQLIELLSVHVDEIDSSHELQADAESMEAALRKKKLNRARIEKLIGKITTAAAGVAALANAVDAVQTAVSRLFT
jgi:hypothetical protein